LYVLKLYAKLKLQVYWMKQDLKWFNYII